jgi:hypothetical protein
VAVVVIRVAKPAVKERLAAIPAFLQIKPVHN